MSAKVKVNIFKGQTNRQKGREQTDRLEGGSRKIRLYLDGLSRARAIGRNVNDSLKIVGCPYQPMAIFNIWSSEKN